ncbi:MAG TPA: peptidylprolyl isomerase [Actinomycetota bacterium]|nr:peptidylprolyl isomerase [Actinomycetota bacterium]
MAQKSWSDAPAMEIDPSRRYTAVIETSMGTITAELFAAEVPATANNFVFLARQGFYDGLTFHRVIPGFVIQGGDPQGTGAGDAGYAFADELDNDLAYELGTLAMANAGPHTNGSQFFIVSGPQGERLPKNYSIFGKVTDGIDVVQAIAAVPTGPMDRPRSPVTMERVSIREE